MSQRRTLILVAAIAIGALASFLVWNYVNGIQDKANGDAAQVSVFLVKEGVPRGTDGTAAAAYISKENMPSKFKPANAITDLADISGKVAVGDLVPNQVVVTDMFVDASDPAARTSFAERLNRIRNEDQTAISIQVDQVRGVAGLIEPGDYVNVMATAVSEVDADGNPVAGDNVLFGAQARYIFQKAEVLAVDQNALPQAGRTAEAAAANGEAAAPAATNSGLITLIVPVRAAQYIASLEPSAVYLTLVASDYVPVPQEQIDAGAAIPAEDPSMLTPYGPKGPEGSEG